MKKGVNYLKKGVRNEFYSKAKNQLNNDIHEGNKKEIQIDKEIKEEATSTIQSGAFEKCLSSIYNFLNSEPNLPRSSLVDEKNCPQFSEDYDPKKPLLVLDMDETLLHTRFTKKKLGYDVKVADSKGHCYYVSFILFFGANFKLNVDLRPYLYHFLNEARYSYNLVLFTASEEYYAKEIIRYFDPENEYFVAHLFR